MRELVKMADSVPVEAKRLSALETKSVTRRTLEVHAASVREFCDCSSLSGRQRCEGFASGQTSHRVQELAFFSDGPGLARRETIGKRPHLLSNFRKTSVTTATRQAFAQPEKRRILVAVPPSRGEPAGGYGAISTTPLWSFG